MSGDEIYLFEFVDGKKTEYGVIVLNNGKIRKRIVDMTTGTGGSVKPPTETRRVLLGFD